ncbi:MAG: response regulator [Chloroflexota bacterium]
MIISLKSSLQAHTVLVVDDEADSLLVCRMLLEMYGATVITAINGNEALAKIKSTSFDLIISDLSMPKMDGWQLLEHIRQDDDLKEIPVIALTAHAMSGDRTKALNAGFDNYMTKPLIPETFRKELAKIIAETPSIVKRRNTQAEERYDKTPKSQSHASNYSDSIGNKEPNA